MIDIAQETLVPISEVPARLPKRPNGKKLHISSVYRWIQRGLRGIRLETVRIGGTVYTSSEALQRFANRLTQPTMSNPQMNLPEISKRRQQEIEAARRRLDEILGPKKKPKKP